MTGHDRAQGGTRMLGCGTGSGTPAQGDGMTELTKSSWYVVHTHPHVEGKVVTHLRRQGFDTYLPMFRKNWRHAGRSAVVLRPLFPRYLFVAIDITSQRWRTILSTFGVADLLRQGEWPTVVPAGVVEDIRSRERGGALCESFPAERFLVGESVKLTDGAFSDMIGTFQEMSDAERVIVLLSMMGREVKIQVPAESIAAA